MITRVRRLIGVAVFFTAILVLQHSQGNELFCALAAMLLPLGLLMFVMRKVEKDEIRTMARLAGLGLILGSLCLALILTTTQALLWAGGMLVFGLNLLFQPRQIFGG